MHSYGTYQVQSANVSSNSFTTWSPFDSTGEQIESHSTIVLARGEHQ